MNNRRQVVEDELFDKWDDWIQKLDELLMEIVMHQYLYQEVRKVVINNPRVAKPNHFYEWLWYKYTTGLAVDIRKLADRDDRTISLRTLLKAIQRNPQILSRARYKAKYVNCTYEERDADRDLDKVLGTGNQQADAARIQEQIDELVKKR